MPEPFPSLRTHEAYLQRHVAQWAMDDHKAALNALSPEALTYVEAEASRLAPLLWEALGSDTDTTAPIIFAAELEALLQVIARRFMRHLLPDEAAARAD